MGFKVMFAGNQCSPAELIARPDLNDEASGQPPAFGKRRYTQGA